MTMIKYALCDRGDGALVSLRGISCDEDGVFLAGEVPLVSRSSDEFGATVYKRRPAPEINFLFFNKLGYFAFRIPFNYKLFYCKTRCIL